MPNATKRVILIEDDEFIRDIYVNELNEAGIPTDGFADGESGYSALTKTHYDLLLLDIMLPDTNGVDILRRVKLNPDLAHLDVVMLTNLGQESIQREAQLLGAKGYLIKLAYTPAQITAEVKKILSIP